MAFDAGMLRAVLHEISDALCGGKIEKINQPTYDEVNIAVKNAGKTYRLVINVGSSAPRIALSNIVKENPPVPPVYCMLLRKHLIGAKLTEVNMVDYDRVAFLHFAAYDDMGYPCEKRLVAEIMGKYANLILLSADNKILAAVKTVDFSDSSVRQIMPGLHYELPAPPPDKYDPLTETEEGFYEKYVAALSDRPIDKYLTGTYLGTALQVAREIVFRAAGRTDARMPDVSIDKLYSAFREVHSYLIRNEYRPTAVFDADGSPREYFYMPVGYFGDKGKIKEYPDFASLFDSFFCERDRVERIRQRATDLIRMLSNAKNRVMHRLEAQRSELAASEKSDEYKVLGDLITANIYRLKRGMYSVMCTDYSVDPPLDVPVTLDTRLSPAQNAQHYYRLYNKAKTAHRVLGEQIVSGEEELTYLESVETFLSRSETEEDLSDIREELFHAGYASRMKNYTPPKSRKIRPIEAYTVNGYKLLCGRNNIQNEYLTFKVAEKNDLWFHAKGVPGSHVILVCGGEEPPAEDYTDAAAFAAYHSEARKNPQAPVDYTRVKNIKKPAGGKPGLVIYHTNYSAYVEPRDLLKKED